MTLVDLAMGFPARVPIESVGAFEVEEKDGRHFFNFRRTVDPFELRNFLDRMGVWSQFRKLGSGKDKVCLMTYSSEADIVRRWNGLCRVDFFLLTSFLAAV